MPPREPRFFLCTGECVKYDELHQYPDSHILGHLCYVTDEGKPVTALARWDVSVACQVVPPLTPVIDCFLIGDARAIRCRYPECHNKQRWEIGKAAFMVLMSRYPRRKETSL